MTAPLIVPHHVGGWLPKDHNVVRDWLDKKIKLVQEHPQPLVPVVQGLKDLIEGDTEIYMLFHQMFEQVPRRPPYNMDPTLQQPQIRNYHVLLQLLNHVMTHAPAYNGSDLVGFPINAVLDWPMGTKSGFAAFLDKRVNDQFRKILNYWKVFLGSPDSRAVLNKDPDGWFGEAAMATMPDFDKMFVCNPLAEYHGFKSWDDFFTRQFRDGIRPVELPGNNKVINNACESAPYNIQVDVKERDRFWIKGQPYSLHDMLANDRSIPKFIGGTVYQAFLSAKSYHRWHSPVNGTIVRSYLIPGTYYSEAPSMGMDPSAPNSSQGYITSVAARQVIFIEADNPKIGLMGFLAVGMAEVSSCEVTVKDGSKVKKGEEIGMFHFGGSTHCLIFQKGINIKWDLKGQTPSLDAHNLNINSAIGYVED